MSNNSIKILLDLQAGVDFPSLAAIPFKIGMAMPKILILNWHLINGATHQPEPCHKEIVAHWPDGSVRWVHVHAIFKGGVPYYLNNLFQAVNFQFASIPPDSQLKWIVEVEDDQGIIWSNNVTDRSSNAMAVIPAAKQGPDLTERTGGRSYNGKDETKIIELKSSVLRLTRYEGWLKAEGHDPWLRYCTRVTRYAGSDVIKFSHSVIFAGSMIGRKLKHISLRLPARARGSNKVNTSADNEQIVLNQPVNDQFSVHQRKPDHCEMRAGNFSRDFNQADGYLGYSNHTVYCRDFWQKFPQELAYKGSTIVYRQWYGKDSVFDEPGPDGTIERLEETNLSRLLHWHQGPFLVNDPPKNGQGLNGEWADRFYGLMRGDENPVEEDVSYTDFADMEGIMIHDECCIRSVEHQRRDFNLAGQENPVGRCEPAYIESTKVMDFAAMGTDFPELELFMENSIKGYMNPERFNDFGRFVFGDGHRIVYPPFFRSSFHRMFMNCYYGDL